MAKGKQRLMRDTFWTDNYVEKLIPDEKLVFIYLLTNPLNNIAGIYEIRRKRIAFDTGFDVDVVDNILDRFKKDGKVLLYDEWIVIVNHIKNQALNPSILKGCRRILLELPEDMRVQITGWVQAGLLNLTLLNLTLLNLTSFFSQDESEEKEIVESSKYNFEEIDMKFAELLEDKVKANFKSQASKKTNLESWAETFRKIRKLDEHTPEEIYFTICWVQGGEVGDQILPEHDFWSANVQSPSKLREQWYKLWAQIEQGKKKQVKNTITNLDLNAIGL